MGVWGERTSACMHTGGPLLPMQDGVSSPSVVLFVACFAILSAFSFLGIPS